MPRTSIRRRLVTLMMLTSTTVLLLTGAALIVYDVISFRQSLVNGLTTRAGILAANSTAALAFQNPEDARHVLAALKTDPRMVAAALYDAKGHLFATYPANLSPSAVPSAPIRQGSHFDRSSLAVLQPVFEQGRQLGSLYLLSDLLALRARLRIYGLVVLLAVAGSLGVAFALSTWLQRGIAEPVQALADTARRVSENRDYSIRATAASQDEIGVLTESFNDMLHQIQERDLEIRQLNVDLERRVVERTAELEATNRELEAFTYSVSHDLRAPVRHIAGFTDLLQKRSAAGLDDGGRRYLTNIADSAKRMGDLVDDLLMFSRMGRSEMRSTRVSLGKMLSEVIKDLDEEVKGRQIEWKLGSLPDVQADPAMLRLVLANLVSNAVKYTRPRPKATIEIDSEARDGETVLWVRDNGIGFDMEYSSKLFGVFQRLHGADEFEGTGIGLANVRRIVHRHGGRTWAEGAVDKGATFYFSLPEMEEAA